MKKKSKKVPRKRKPDCTSHGDAQLTLVVVMLIFIAIYFMVVFFLCLKRHVPYSQFLSELDIRTISPYVIAFSLIAVLAFINWIVYRIKCHVIISKGICHKNAELIDYDTVRKIGDRSNYYSYKAKLPDGRIIKTERYMFNNYYELTHKRCTVYEYNGKYVCRDFK
jgi:hypothetical protein